jgi:Ca2+-binding RTX toxin-like protein
MAYYGDTVWQLTPYMSATRYVIDDSSGNDWFDFSSWTGQYAYNLTIDIRPGAIYRPVAGFNYVLEFKSWTVIEYVYGGDGHDRIIGNDVGNYLYASGGNDDVWAQAGNDVVYGGLGADTIRGEDGNDAIYGDNPAETVANNLNDLLYGGRGNDALVGGGGNDVMYGDGGNDTLYGHAGQDHLVGGAGFDTFVLREVMVATRGLGGTTVYVPGWESPVTAPDIIYDFENPGNMAGDVIDLRAIDARTVSYPNMNFKEWFIFNYRGVGGIWLENMGTDTVVYGNTADGVGAEFAIIIRDGANVFASAYTAADFLLY